MSGSAYISRDRDPDALYDDMVVAEVKLQLRRDGSMTIAGNISDTNYIAHMLRVALDEVRGTAARMRDDLMIPPHGVAIQEALEV
jgi:hypothetical protein